MTKRIPTFAVLRRRDFALLWSGQIITDVGNWVLWIALPFHMYEWTGSALATGFMLIVKDLPPVLLGSLSGVFVDRWDTKRVIVTTSLLQALALLLLPPGRMELVYLAILCQSLAQLFFHPASGSLVPRLVGERELLAANNLNAFGGNLASLAGPALGGLLSGRLGLSGVALVRCATLLATAALANLITSPSRPATTRTGPGNSADFKGLKAIWSDWQRAWAWLGEIAFSSLSWRLWG